MCSGTSQANCANGTQLYGNTVGWSGTRTVTVCDSVKGQCQDHRYDECNRLTSTVVGGDAPQGNYSPSCETLLLIPRPTGSSAKATTREITL